MRQNQDPQRKYRPKKETPPPKKGGAVSTFMLGLLLLVGLGIVLFPFISQYSYYRASKVEVQEFATGAKVIDRAEVDRRVGLARAYNDSLVSGVNKDPFTEVQKEGRQEYARMLEVHEKIGYLNIPKLSAQLPIYAGTAEAVLQKGVGHMENTSLPVGGNSTHAVLTAHRGLPTARLFTDLDKLVIGDKFYIHYIGGTVAYQVDQIKIVLPTDFTELKIVPGHDYLTLLTCTPYMVNSHRLLVRGHRIEYVEAVEEKEIRENKVSNTYQILFYITLALLVLVVSLWFFLWRRRKKRERQGEASVGGQ